MTPKKYLPGLITALATGISLSVVVTTGAGTMQSPFLKFLQNDPLDSISKALTTLPIHSTAAATALANTVLADAAALKKNILAIAPSERTYANTVRAYDHMAGIIGMACDALQTVQFLSTDIENRSAPYEKILNEIGRAHV